MAAPDKAHQVTLQALLVDEDGSRKEVDWLTVEPPQTLSISGGKTETVTIIARPSSKTPPGRNSIQLAIGDNERPNDTYAYSSSVICEVVGASERVDGKKRPQPPRWLIPAMLANFLLAVAGIAVGWKACTKDVPQGASAPSGTVVAFGGTTVPDGWRLCNGDPVSRKDYAALYAAIGDAWGAGDGVNTFNLPDLRGFFLRGADEKGLRDQDPKGRRAANGQPATGVGSMQRYATAMPHSAFQIANSGEHFHLDPTWNAQPGPYELATNDKGFFGADYGVQAAPTTPAGIHTHTLAGGDEETRPVNVAVNYIIKI